MVEVSRKEPGIWIHRHAALGVAKAGRSLIETKVFHCIQHENRPGRHREPLTVRQASKRRGFWGQRRLCLQRARDTLASRAVETLCGIPDSDLRLQRGGREEAESGASLVDDFASTAEFEVEALNDHAPSLREAREPDSGRKRPHVGGDLTVERGATF